MDGYKLYIRIDADNRIIDGYADWQQDKRASDEILIAQDGPRQFHLYWTEPLMNPQGQLLFRWINGQRVERSQAELDAELAARPVPPDPDAELAMAIQAATTLTELKAALLGSGGKTARVKGKIK